MKRLKAEWIPHMKAYRLYDPGNPLHYCTTVAYVEDLEEARRQHPEYEIVEVDIDTMHVECL